MIVYRYKLYNQERELCIKDNGPGIMRCNTDEEEAYLFVKHTLEPKVKKIFGASLECKKFLDQTTPNMIQGLKGIFARKPLISRGIYSFLNFIRFREGCFLCLNLMKEKNEAL